MLPEEEKKLIQKIREQWAFWFKKQSISQLLHIYIPSDCSNSQNYSEGSRYSLNKVTEDFLKHTEQQILLVLGDSGSGKTSLTLKLEQSYWETHSKLEAVNGYIPIRIELKSYTTKAITGCIEDTLERKYELAKDEINHLKKSKSIKLLIIFDGYDEIGGRAGFNMYHETKLSEWNCEIKSVVACHNQYFIREKEFKKHFILRQSQTNTNMYENLKVIYVAPFSEIQIQQYLIQYLEEHAKKKEVNQFPLEEIQELLKTQIEFKSLLSNPFVLKIFSDIAPKLLNITDTSKAEKVRKISRAQIYQSFLEYWFFQAKTSLEESIRVSNLSQKPIDAERYFFGYAQRLAYSYFRETIAELTYKEVSSNEKEFKEYQEIIEGNNAFNEFFSSEQSEVIKARNTCPLRRSGKSTYTFVHKSFQDYLVARHLYLVLKDESKKLTLEHWNARYLSEERAILSFLSELVEDDPNRKELQERLLKIVKISSKTKTIDTASSNAISVLNWNRYGFGGMDLEGIRIPRAYLEGVNFYGANLSNSRLNESDVSNSEWSEANLTGSDLRGLEFGEYPSWEQESGVGCLVFNEERTRIATGDYKGVLRLWSFPEGQLLREYRGHTEWISSVAFSLDGKHLASGSWDGTIRIWNVERGALVKELKGHMREVTSVDFCSDGKHLASGSWDKTIRIWDVERGVLERELIGHTDVVTSVGFRSDGKRLASGSYDETIRIWNIESGALEAEFRDHTNYITSVSWSFDGKCLASGSYDRTIRIWDVEHGVLERKLRGHTGRVTSVSWSVDGKRLVSGSYDRTIRIWDVDLGVLESELKGHTGGIKSVSLIRDGRWLVSGGKDHMIRVWNVEYKGIERGLRGHTDAVTSVSFRSDGKCLASGSWDRTIRI